MTDIIERAVTATVHISIAAVVLYLALPLFVQYLN